MINCHAIISCTWTYTVLYRSLQLNVKCLAFPRMRIILVQPRPNEDRTSRPHFSLIALFNIHHPHSSALFWSWLGQESLQNPSTSYISCGLTRTVLPLSPAPELRPRSHPTRDCKTTPSDSFSSKASLINLPHTTQSARRKALISNPRFFNNAQNDILIHLAHTLNVSRTVSLQCAF